METINLNGQSVHTYGTMPQVGDKCPHFSLVKNDLTVVTDEDFVGKKLILNIFPSLDTKTCAMTVRRFNMQAANLDNTVVLAVSADLPFAAERFCATENIENVITLSTYRNPQFGRCMGLEMIDGALQGLLARAVFVVDEERYITHCQLVRNVSHEPDYQSALDAVEKVVTDY